MRSIWTGCLGMSLLWGGATVAADGFAATRAGAGGAAASLGRPVAVAAPAAESNRPPLTDGNVTPAALNLIGRPRPLPEGRQEPESTLPQPTPVPPPTAAPSELWGATLNRPVGHPAGVPNGVASPFSGAGCCDTGTVPDCCMPGWGCFGVGADQSHFWMNGEYLLWWMRDSRLPPLVTTSPTGTPFNQAGVLGTPGAGVLLGDSKIKHDERSGGRFSLGWWCDDCHTLGFDANFFFLGQRTVNFLAGSGGDPILARPFVDAITGRETSQLVAFPGQLAGSVRVELPSRLWGADTNLRKNLWRGCCWSLDCLVGFRYLDLHESLGVTEFLAVPGPAGQPPSLIIVNDRFSARNQFYGGQLGLQWEVRKGPWYVDVTGKVALGGTQQVVNIDGTTTFIPPGSGPITQPGGLLAQRTNSGRFEGSQFSVVPEIGVRLGYQLRPHLRAFVGYNFLFWSNVARPADQIDRVVNTQQIPSIFGPGQVSTGLNRPMFVFRDTDFWVQGISFGFELRF